MTPACRPNRILIVDDEADIRNFLSSLFQADGFDCLEAPTGEEGLELIRQGIPSLVLLDINLPGMDGMRVLKEAKKVDAATPIILMTGNGTIQSAVEAVKAGAYDYVTKPFRMDELMLTIRRALESRELRKENQFLRSQVEGKLSLRELMGSSDGIAQVFAAVERVAPTDFTVVVRGETGSGKELVARAVHQRSLRAAGPFVPVDCGAVQPNLIESELFGHEKGAFTGADRGREGKFEQAAGGTLFLDEVQNLPLEVQAKFLRALQERQICRVGGSKTVDIDLRVIAASNQDLEALVAAGKFRHDLFHRLDEFALVIPPLRDRGEDLVYLTRRFMEMTCQELNKDVRGISREALDVLADYRWPGNVRELRNVIRRAVLLADVMIRPEHLTIQASGRGGRDTPILNVAPLDGGASLKDLVRRHTARVEREILRQVLEQTGGNKAKAARLLQIDYKTIQTKTKEYGLTTGEKVPIQA